VRRVILTGNAARVWNKRERLSACDNVVLASIYRELEQIRADEKRVPIQVGGYRCWPVPGPSGDIAVLVLHRKSLARLYIEDILFIGGKGASGSHGVPDENESGESRAEGVGALALTGAALRKLLREAIAWTGESRRTRQQKAREAWEAAVSYFGRARLWEDERYRGKYLAIKDKKVVDCDADRFRLARRMAERLPGQRVLIAKAEKEPPVVELPSPELER